MRRTNLFNSCCKTAPGNVTVNRTHTIIAVSSDFNTTILTKAPSLGGYFSRDTRQWIFPRSKECQVEELFVSTFGKWDSIPERKN